MTGKAQGRKRKVEEFQESGGRPRKKGKIIIYESESDSDETPIKGGSKRSSGAAAAVDDDNSDDDSGECEDNKKGEGDTGHATEDEHEESSEESQDTDDKPLRELHRFERRKSVRHARGKKDSDKESESQRESEGDDSAESTHTQDDAEDSEESQSATPEDDSLSDEEGHPKSRKKCDNCARMNKTCMKRSGFDSCAPCHFAGIECRFPVSRRTFIMDEADDYGTNLKYAG